MNKNKPTKIGDVRVRPDGLKVTTVDFDGGLDYRARMDELNKKELEGGFDQEFVNSQRSTMAPDTTA
jgi:hypothetical protein